MRQDGRTAWGWKDKLNSRKVAHELEERYGLRRTGVSDRTSHRQPEPKETSKARRLGRVLTTRDELRRRVRASVAASLSEEEFFARLGDDGVLVRLRPSLTNPDEITGYSVALPADVDASGEPVYFGASKLATDLSLPKLRVRWGTGRPNARWAGPGMDEAVQVSPEQRAKALSDAAADTLTAVASTVEGGRGGPLTEATELFDKAARAGYAKVARATSRSYEMRAMARLVRLMCPISGDEDSK